MELMAFKLVAGQAPEPMKPEELWSDPSLPFWLDVTTTERGELEKLLVRLRVDPLIQRLLRDESRRPLAEAVAGQAVLRLPRQRRVDEDENLAWLILLEHGVVSIHETPYARLSELANPEIDTSGLRLDDPIALAIGMLHMLVKMDLDVVTAFRARVDALAAAERADPCDRSLDEIGELGQRAENLTAVLEDQLYCLNAIPALELLLPRGEALVRLSETQRHSLEHVSRVLERATRRLEQVQDQRSLHAQDSTNRRLKVLTLVQSIFTPLTLIAGIWGMNFEHMPELSLPNAYYAALGLMALVAVGNLALFWRHGWFD